MKKIMYLIIGLLLMSIVKADTNIDLIAVTDEDLNFNADLNVGGDIDLTIDGMNFGNTVNSLWQGIDSSTMTMNYIFYKMSEIFIKKNHMKNIWEIVNPSKLDNIQERRFRWIMDTYFIPRTEVNQMMNELRAENLDLRLRIEALEKLAGEEAVLKGRLNVAKDYDIDLTFNNETYHNVDDGFITLKTIEQEAIEEPEEIEEEPKDLLMEKQVEKWKELCSRGLKQFCLILEQRGW